MIRLPALPTNQSERPSTVIFRARILPQLKAVTNSDEAPLSPLNPVQVLRRMNNWEENRDQAGQESIPRKTYQCDPLRCRAYGGDTTC